MLVITMLSFGKYFSKLIMKIHCNSNFYLKEVKEFFHPITVNSRLADTPLLRTLAITDKIQIPGE